MADRFFRRLAAVLICAAISLPTGNASFGEEAEALLSCAHENLITREESGIPATCTENGTHQIITICADCGAEISRQNAMDLATGHDYVETARVHPTCTEGGSVTYTCVRCGNSYQEAEGAAKGHLFQETEHTPATCTENGSVTFSCTQCGLSYTESSGAALGHDYRESGRRDATVELEGMVSYSCARCGDSYTETLPKLPPSEPQAGTGEHSEEPPAVPQGEGNDPSGNHTAGTGEDGNDSTDQPTLEAETGIGDTGDSVSTPEAETPDDAGNTSAEETTEETSEEEPNGAEPETDPEGKESEKAEGVPNPEEPFEQHENVEGVRIAVTAEAGTFAAGTRLTIRRSADGDFAGAVETVLGTEDKREAKFRHQIFSISGAELKGSASISLEGLNFTEIRSAYPEGSLSVQVMRYNADGGNAAAKAVRIPARIDTEGNSVSFHTDTLGLFDIVSVVKLPKSSEASEEESNLVEESTEGQENLQNEECGGEADSSKTGVSETEKCEAGKPAASEAAGTEAEFSLPDELTGKQGEASNPDQENEGEEAPAEPGTLENMEDILESDPEESGGTVVNEAPEVLEEEIPEEQTEAESDALEQEWTEESPDAGLLAAGETVFTESYIPEGLGDQKEALDRFVKGKLPGSSFLGTAKARSTAGVQAAGSNLSGGSNTELYRCLGALVVQVAEGNRTSTEFVIDAQVVGWGDYLSAGDLDFEGKLIKNNKVNSDVIPYLKKFYEIDTTAVSRALVSDYPFDLYWLAKDVEISYNYNLEYEYFDETPRIRISSVTVQFPVDVAYQAGGPYLFNTNLPAKVNAAVSRINQIVQIYSDQSLAGKVTGFKQEICNLVDYDTSVNPGQLDGDAWQLIYVFDGDPETRVVSDGYAKSFKYLCDLSGVPCITVNGEVQIGNGSRQQLMWNIVRLGNGEYDHFHVDTANSDTGRPGFPDELLLKDVQSDLENDSPQYSRTLPSGLTITYYFVENSMSGYDAKWQNLSTSSYGSTLSAHTVEISTGAHGRVEADLSLAEAGTTINLTILPDPGYELDSWSVVTRNGQNPVQTGSGTGYSFVMPNEDVVVTVAFRQSSAPEFTNHSLVLTGMVGVDFYLTLPEGESLQNYEGAYVTFTGNKLNSQTRYSLADAPVVSGMYKFTAFITSIQMADLITPVLHYSRNGADLTVTGTPYSAEDYIRWAASSGSLSTREMHIVKALADYGYYAQQYLSRQNGWTIGTDYAAMTLHYTDSYDEAAVQSAASASAFSRTEYSTVIDSVQYRMNMGSQIKLTVRMLPKEGQTIGSVTLNGKAVETQASGNYIMVSQSGILATELANMFTIQAGDSTIRVSPMSYVYDVLRGAGSGEYVRQFMCAFYYYGQACSQ